MSLWIICNKNYNKCYNQKLYHFSGFPKNDVNLVKLIFQRYIPKVIVKIICRNITKLYARNVFARI